MKKRKKEKKQPVFHHYTAQYLLNPQHPVTVHLIGCGGTGSQMLTQLARIHIALNAIGHPGLHVQAWDDDVITEANLGRQMFSPMDIGQNKAVVLITRINRFFGLKWVARAERYGIKSEPRGANIIITAVDNVATREFVGGDIVHKKSWNYAAREKHCFYWLDLGNSKTAGQVILGTFEQITQPKKTRHTVGRLPTITDLYPNLKKHETADQGPSCSLAEALGRQDLFINSVVAQYGATLIWKLFKNLRLRHHGAFINLETLTTNPISVLK